MARRRKTSSKRHSATERKDPGTWERYEPILRQLYMEKHLALPKVMKIMKQEYQFDATKKQYRYRFEKWECQKYGLKRSQRPNIQSDSSADMNGKGSLEITESSATIPEDSDQECGNDMTPSSSDSEGPTRMNASSLRQQFLSVFSGICYPVLERFQDLITAGLQDPAKGESWLRNRDAIIGDFMQNLGLTNGSINVIAYHHLNYALASFGQLGQERAEAGDESKEHLDDEPFISRQRFIERQPWYRAFDESSPASRCLSYCLDWIKQQLRIRLPREMALSYFDTLGMDAGHSPNTSKQDVCLFVYLVDALLDDLASQVAQRPGDRWDQLSEEAVGISPIETLRTMSSLILGMVYPDPQSPPQRRSARNIRRKGGAGGDQLIDSALSGIEVIENTHDKRALVLQFVTEFVWIHDPNRRRDGEESRFEAEARLAAEAYADAKLSVPIEAAYTPNGAASDDTGIPDDASDIPMKDSD
ncbi:hypothetical protein Hte_004435 [Hypoxylon texense]